MSAHDGFSSLWKDALTDAPICVESFGRGVQGVGNLRLSKISKALLGSLRCLWYPFPLDPAPSRLQ